LYSFDVFDTIITRTVATPRGIFSLIQKELLTNDSFKNISLYFRKNFYDMRINAEELANFNYCQNGIEDKTLEQIYHTMALNSMLSEVEIELLIGLEKRIEFENVIPIMYNINIIKDLLSKNQKVILISDMYLDELTIRKMLIKADKIFIDITLYVSSDIKLCKYSGNLFRHIANVEKSSFDKWIHCGDNIESDYNIPRAIGINCLRYEYKQLIPCAKNEINNNEKDWYKQLIIGTSRNCILDSNKISNAKQYGSYLGGAILFPYVWWLLEQSLLKGYNRLYFIARDGYILKKIADIIIEEMNYDISTKYIYGSRKAWRIASLNEKSQCALEIFGSSYVGNAKNIDEMADIFDMSGQTLSDAINIKYNNDNIPVLGDFLKLFLLHNESDFIKLILKNKKQDRKLIVEYLKQEIDFSDERFAFVEMSGSGLTQECLSNIIEDFYNKPINTFFFKLDKVNHIENCKFHVFIPSLMYLNVVIEMLSRAPHGQTMRYKKILGRVLPILEDGEEEELIKHGLNDYIEGINEFSMKIMNQIKFNNFSPNDISIILDYMLYITKTPDKDLMVFIGGMPNSVTGREKEIVEFAPVLSEEQIKSIYLNDTDKPIGNFYKGSAIEYSLLRSGIHIQNMAYEYSKQLEIIHFNKQKEYNANLQMSRYVKRFPFVFLKKRIILYAAGKFGLCLYNVIKCETDVNIVAWVDKKYYQINNKQVCVENPENIIEMNFDQLIIAVLDSKQAHEIRDYLLSIGIKSNKILWFNVLN